MDIVVKSRHCEVSERFRDHVEEKIGRLEKHDHRIIRVDVEIDMEKQPSAAGPGRPGGAHGVLQGTGDPRRGRRRGQARRARPGRRPDGRPDAPRGGPQEGAPRPAYPRLRRRRRSPASTSRSTAPARTATRSPSRAERERRVGPLTVTGEGPLVVREKTHAAAPMTLAQALYEMELVGHDFFLFVDQDSDQPSVVYRRKGYDYGVISLDVG